MEKNSQNGQALVLGGGGVTGIAWLTGLILGLSEAGVDLGDAGLFIGTSAGSAVAAQLATGVPIEQLYAAQLEATSGEISVSVSLADFQAKIMAIVNKVGNDPQSIRAELGKQALAQDTVPEEARIEVMRQRLPVQEWPERKLLISAVDTGNGDWKVFDRNSGADLVRVVAASCAVPLVWPPVTIDGHRYMDGGMRSGTNADLASGYGKVLILAPIAEPENMPPIFGSNTRVEKQLLESEGSQVLVITPDKAALDAIGPNPLDPSRRAPAARSGYAQGKALAELLNALWN